MFHEAAELIGDPGLTREVEQASERLVEVTLNEGTDTDGSLFNESEDGVLDTDKHWWPQAEAMVGYLDAYEISWEFRVSCRMHTRMGFHQEKSD